MTIRFRKPTKLGEAWVSWLRVEGRALECTAATCLYFRKSGFCSVSIGLGAALVVVCEVLASSGRRRKADVDASTLVVVAESIAPRVSVDGRMPL